MKGTYVLKPSKKVAVAVKTLKEEDIPGQKVYIYKLKNSFFKFLTFVV